jgi:hypothetical protein
MYASLEGTAKIINGNGSGKLGGGIFYTTDFERK